MQMSWENSARQWELDSLPDPLTLLLMNVQEEGTDLYWVPVRNSLLPSFQLGYVSVFIQAKESAELAAFHFALF